MVFMGALVGAIVCQAAAASASVVDWSLLCSRVYYYFLSGSDSHAAYWQLSFTINIHWRCPIVGVIFVRFLFVSFRFFLLYTK